MKRYQTDHEEYKFEPNIKLYVRRLQKESLEIAYLHKIRYFLSETHELNLTKGLRRTSLGTLRIFWPPCYLGASTVFILGCLFYSLAVII